MSDPLRLLREARERRGGAPLSSEGVYAVMDEDGELRVPDGPWRDNKLWVLTRKCSTCIFRPGNLMRLAEGRVDDMVAECIIEGTVIPCHQTLDGPRSICRGLVDKHYRDIGILQVADRLGALAYDDPPEDH